jgi:hypothetical protein
MRAKRGRDFGSFARKVFRRFEELILRPRQSEIFSQRLALVFASEQASTLQLGDNLVDEVLDAFGHVRKHDVEAVATLLESHCSISSAIVAGVPTNMTKARGLLIDALRDGNRWLEELIANPGHAFVGAQADRPSRRAGC